PLWQQRLTLERDTQTFGLSTQQLFDALLLDLHIPANRFVNEAVVGRLNAILEDLGAFRPSPPAPSGGIFPLGLGARGPKVAELHSSLRQLGYAISPSESAAKLFGDTTLRAVASFQQLHGLEPNGAVDEVTAQQIGTAAGVRRNEPQVVLGIVRRSNTTAV